MPELIALCRIMLAMLESAHYAPEDLLCSKLCWHNLSRPSVKQGRSYAVSAVHQIRRHIPIGPVQARVGKQTQCMYRIFDCWEYDDDIRNTNQVK